MVTPAAKFWICKRAPCSDVRGDGGAWRLRLHRGKHHAAALSRSAGQFDLGGLRAISCASTCCAPSSARRRPPKCCNRNSPAMRASRLSPIGCKSASAPPIATTKLQARALVRDLVLALQAALLIKHAPAVVADAFCASRLGEGAGGAFGTLPRGLDLARSPSAPRRLAKASRKSPPPASPAPQSRPRRRACEAPGCPTRRR